MASNFDHYVSSINNSLKELDSERSLHAGLKVSKSVMEVLGEVDVPMPDIIIDEGLLRLPNSERQDAWFHQHPWMRDERCAFQILDSEIIPIQAKYYWLKKKSKSLIAGCVHFTKNWEDHEFTRNSEYKVGIDFFLTPGAESVLVVLSNYGNLRVLELSQRLSNTQIDILKTWHSVRNSKEIDILHKSLWESLRLQSVNNSFYEGISKSFNELLLHLVGVGKKEDEAKLFSSRLLGRVIFVWFLRRMNLINESMGYFDASDVSQKNYYQTHLEALFFNTLNTPIEERISLTFSSNSFQDTSTPYLNGGLFAPQVGDWSKDDTLTFPAMFFERLFEHFNNFNFTTDESTPEYEQVAIDPEMLGRVFESLLASQISETGEQARKAKGTFYTPREIVSFMCKESLRSHLLNGMNEDIRWHKSVSKLLDTTDQDWVNAGTNSIRDIPTEFRKELVSKLDDLKVIDPACGSGAFPIGMIQLLVKTYNRLDKRFDSYRTKLQIIQNNIFGVDIEPMAIEISRMRTWLSLVVDEEDRKNVAPLPNLDFKFVCANTLVPLAEADIFNDLNLQDELKKLRSDYFSARSPSKKLKHQEKYLELTRPALLDSFDERSAQLKSFNPFDDREPATYFDPEHMFGIDSGFNIVIGNPPYVDYRKIPSHTKPALSSYEVARHSKMISLYIYFFEKGFNLLSEGGVLAYITPQQYLIYKNTKGLRDIIRKMRLVLLADFARANVFDAATYTFVSLIEKRFSSQPASYLEFNDVRDLTSPKRELLLVNPIDEPVNISEFSDLCKSIESVTMDKLSSIAKTFCACSSTDVVVSDSEVGPKFLAASDIFEWRIRATERKVDPQTYPQGSLNKQINCPRIYTSRMTSSIRATIVTSNEFLGGKVNVVHGCNEDDLFSIVALLNSKLINFWFREKYSMQHLQGGALPINTDDLDEIPLPVRGSKWKKLSELSRSASAANEENLTAILLDIEKLIFDLYGIDQTVSEMISSR